MKAKDLIKMLEENPEFEVELSMMVTKGNHIKDFQFHQFKIIGIDDIGYSSKKIQLAFKEI